MRSIYLWTCGAALAIPLASPPAAGVIPPRPEDIAFPPLAFEPPDAAEYRHTLANGVTVYLAPSREFPLIDLTFTFKGGSYLDPPQKVGVAAAMGTMLRRGGTKTVSAEQMDETFDYLAAVAGSSCGPRQSSASLNCLASNFDESFALFMDMLRHPGFQGERFQIYVDEVVERMKQRNDDAADILRREWSALVYGRDHFEARPPTGASIGSITVDDLHAMHRRIFHPGHLIVAVAGDFEPPDMLARLEAAFRGWEAGPPASDPPPPAATLTPGVYHLEKDIPQGKVYLGLRGIRRDDPDYLAMRLMNRILGGGGFTSRITTRVRSDEGLAYSARSAMIPRVHYPGEIRASVQSKNPTVALATKIILEEIDRIRTEPVEDDELQTAKNALIETFPRTFESKVGMLNVFVNDAMTDRAPDYWKIYRDRVRAVSAEDILAVARRYLLADRMAILLIGRWDEMAPGDLDGRARMSDFFGGSVTHLPLRDPLTQEPLE